MAVRLCVLFVPGERHDAILEDLRRRWQGRGYRNIKQVKVSERGFALLEANTSEGFNLILESAAPAVALALGINSPCRRSPEKLW